MSQTYVNQIRSALQKGNLNTKTIVTVVIFGAIILTFVLSDVTGRNTGGLGMGAAAEVNGEVITIKDYQDQEARIMDYYSKMFGGKIDNEFQRKQIQAQAMNEIVNNILASQGAEKAHIYTTDAELKKIITEDLPYFKKDGVFQSDLYKALLAQNKMTPAGFEKDIAQQTKSQKLRQLFELGLKPTVLEKNIENELKSKQINVAFVKVDAQSIANSSVAVSAQEVQAKLADSNFMKNVETYYNSHKSEYETQEQVKASHILIKADMSNAAATEQAKAKAETVLKRLAKEDFAKVAAQESEDAGSKIKNGDLGYFTKGRMVKEFEEAAFGLPVGKVSGLVKTQFGFHIIKVTDKKPAMITSLNSAKNEIAKKILADEKLVTVSKSLEEAVAKGDPQSVNDAIAKSGLKWSESGYFDLSQEQVPGANSAQLFKAALGLSKQSSIAKTLVREGESQYVLKLVDVKTTEVKSDAKQSELIDRQKSVYGYSRWVGALKKNAKISTNSAILQ